VYLLVGVWIRAANGVDMELLDIAFWCHWLVLYHLISSLRYQTHWLGMCSKQAAG
jgi:hypothetical protein